MIASENPRGPCWFHPGLAPWLLLLLVSAVLLWPRPARADDVLCQASIPGGISFGTIDPTSATASDSQAQVNYSCTNSTPTNYYITLCLNIGTGPQGLSPGGLRQMAGANGLLVFQLYRDSARSQPWGSIDTPSTPPVSVNFWAFGHANGTPPTTTAGAVTIYARTPGSQANAGDGTFNATFSPADLKITGSASTTPSPGTCSSAGADVSAFSGFLVSATVPPTCTVTADPLDFGQVAGLLSSNVDGTSRVHVQCVNGTAYKIGLDNGLHAIGSTRRMQGPGGYIRYELYRNAARTNRWGDTPGVDTVSRTGNGLVQNRAVNGRVPPQATPSAGDYSDTITVSVTY
ncbi:Csu type fimbrial protein [Rhodanobacter spathiphylli]|jgi:spore coat protein U-like protein|uniref:Spore coat protein U/FanG domain-containing protein n=1 Tax=Rhodanobacter spathiphylli B39 TaxID=1163407 RepID=I4W2Y4_9GAMM|nr:spore coat U domain-containing protein [Rhodanobacter spathiphylli]EIL93825.1 hypothetical protein UU7_06863 [Rhodanobacter spathiphylli B39]